MIQAARHRIASGCPLTTVVRRDEGPLWTTHWEWGTSLSEGPGDAIGLRDRRRAGFWRGRRASVLACQACPVWSIGHDEYLRSALPGVIMTASAKHPGGSYES
jgi:hypothetical protein